MLSLSVAPRVTPLPELTIATLALLLWTRNHALASAVPSALGKPNTPPRLPVLALALALLENGLEKA